MYEKYAVVLAVGAFIFNKKKLLIVKKSLNEQVDGGLWTIPGGKIYPKEYILDGLQREVSEEVGLKIDSPQWIGEDVFQVENVMFHAAHFMCQTKKISVILEKKLIEYKWISSLEEMEKLDFPSKIRKRIVEIFTTLL